MTAGDTAASADLAGLLAGARPETWGRTVLAVAAMHEPDQHGHCRYCRPDPHDRPRWWRRRQRGPVQPCPTRRMLLAEVIAEPPAPQWTPA